MVARLGLTPRCVTRWGPPSSASVSAPLAGRLSVSPFVVPLSIYLLIYLSAVRRESNLRTPRRRRGTHTRRQIAIYQGDFRRPCMFRGSGLGARGSGLGAGSGVARSGAGSARPRAGEAGLVGLSRFRRGPEQPGLTIAPRRARRAPSARFSETLRPGLTGCARTRHRSEKARPGVRLRGMAALSVAQGDAGFSTLRPHRRINVTRS
jgi:hypothetical protein